jgi:hypothetical protein
MGVIGSQWCESKTWVWKKIGVNVNKKHIFDNIDNLVSKGHLEEREIKNKTQYRRNDKGDSELGFLSLMEMNKANQKYEFNRIKELTTIGHKTITDEGEEEIVFTDEGKELLDHVQDQVDRAYMVMIRMNYQSNLKVISQRIANERTELLQQHIDKIMKALTNKFNNDLIKEYFQNHVKHLEFKI